MRAGDESGHPPENPSLTQMLEDIIPPDEENFEGNRQDEMADRAEESAGDADDGEDSAETATFLRVVEEYVETPEEARTSQNLQSASSLHSHPLQVLGPQRPESHGQDAVAKETTRGQCHKVRLKRVEPLADDVPRPDDGDWSCFPGDGYESSRLLRPR